MSGLVSGLVGIQTQAAQPAFGVLGPSSANITGNGATHTGVFSTEIFDQNSDFDGTSTFTAPVTGRYALTAHIRLQGLTGAADSIAVIFVTTNRNWEVMHLGHTNFAATDMSVSGSAIVDMDATNTVTVTVRVTGESSDVVDIAGSSSTARTAFSGMLLA